MKELSKYGEDLEDNRKKIEIDLSYDEYVADKKKLWFRRNNYLFI